MREAVCVGYGGPDSYDFHGLETIQCMVERRKGGETGVKWLQAYRGEKFWDACRANVWSRELMKAALCRSHTLTPARAGFNDVFPSLDQMQRLVKGSGCVPLRTFRWFEVHHDADERPGARLQLRGALRGRGETILDADVFADAGRPHHAGQFLQPSR